MSTNEMTTRSVASDTETHPITAEHDLLLTRHAVRAAAVAVGFDLIGQTKVVTAASELVRNAYIHGGGGELVIDQVKDQLGRQGLRLTVRDTGPGISDVSAALVDGFSTGAGLGHGLGGTRRLMDEFHVDSRPGEGTVVTATRWAT
jgi:serine/threonine-protein kinase RsbT